jgi:hypothetical protein
VGALRFVFLASWLIGGTVSDIGQYEHKFTNREYSSLYVDRQQALFVSNVFPKQLIIKSRLVNATKLVFINNTTSYGWISYLIIPECPVAFIIYYSDRSSLAGEDRVFFGQPRFLRGLRFPSGAKPLLFAQNEVAVGILRQNFGTREYPLSGNVTKDTYINYKVQKQPSIGSDSKGSIDIRFRAVTDRIDINDHDPRSLLNSHFIQLALHDVELAPKDSSGSNTDRHEGGGEYSDAPGPSRHYQVAIGFLLLGAATAAVFVAFKATEYTDNYWLSIWWLPLFWGLTIAFWLADHALDYLVN